MDLVSVFRLLGRRKWIALPVAALSAVLLVVTVLIAPPSFRASSSVVLLSPPSPPSDPDTRAVEPEFQNPYVQLGDLSIVVDILRRLMESTPVADRLAERGLIGTYTVAANADFQRGPIIDIGAEAGTAEEAIDANELVTDELLFQLSNIQERAGTDPGYWITAETVVAPTRATRLFSSTLRRLIVVGALGAMATLGSALLADNIAARRRRRRALGAPDVPDDELDGGDRGGDRGELEGVFDDEFGDEFDDELGGGRGDGDRGVGGDEFGDVLDDGVDGELGRRFGSGGRRAPAGTGRW